MAFQPFKTVLFGFAFSPSLKANVYEAMRLAHFLNAQLIFVHVGEQTAEKEAQFEALLNECPVRPKTIKTYWKVGDPVTTLADACREYQVDLLLLGALKRENVFKYYLGSIARKLTRKAPCSVLLMLNPSIERHPCKHIVVNGFDSPQTQETVEAAFYMGQALQSEKITLVEEISESRVAVSVSDDRTLRKATLRKEKIDREEKIRVTDIVKKIPKPKKEGLKWETQSIFGRRGYSIGHYARVVRADLLVMNAQEEPRFYHRFFPKDLEHILAELPTDVLIIQSHQHA
ncbi:universal stress protein [Flavobacteriaceae bacterium]|jgi:nucleotide-binding universal stress UspA family protein|nr:universal stress protein [Flavobacteriaceae bacterium]MDA7710560.1 universal stress protein [Flavobacteriaceae bacterium]MDA8993138.1 universal stress protein [Flavobacteriaceae bacterium]